jgi:uncharacterized protein (DUF2252 family)
MPLELVESIQAKQRSVEERMDAGKALRKKFPRIRQGKYRASSKRADPVFVLEEQAKSRLRELVPIRYARMLTSPFAFLRGGAAIMAADLAAQGKPTGIRVQACGDMHMANFGLFASAERNLVFGINDFDETLPGPWEWDLKRLVASVVAGGRFLGAGNGLCKDAVRAAVTSYRKKMRRYATMGNLELWGSTMKEDDIRDSLKGTAQKGLEKIARKARQRTHMQVLDKLTDLVDDKFRLRDDAPFIVHVTHTESGVPIKEALQLFLRSYTSTLADDRKYLLSQYSVVDVARKVVGVGSVGLRCWVVFLIGNHDEDPLFLQVKEARPSVLEPFAGRSQYRNHGQRVVAGQRLIQGAPDIFLGWGGQGGMHYYVRQMRDMKGGVEFDPDKVKIENLPQYAALCAWALALAHAKSGDPAIIAGYAGNGDELDEAMVEFAFAYADQTEKDYMALAHAAKAGRVKVAARGAQA